MLWRPMTYGERAFLHIYEALGRHVSVDASFGATLDFLVNERSFQEFAKLHATIETFIRCMRAAVYLQPEIGHLAPTDYGKQLGKRGYVPRSLSSDRRFCELLKQTAIISFEAKAAPPAVAKDIKDGTSDETSRCYLCGIKLTKAGPQRSRPTVEHLWPLSLGGESIEANLIAACEDCNTKRANSITWAWGPVQSTDYRHDPKINPDVQLRISLAMAKLMLEASGERRGGRCSLKQAALRLAPLFPNLDIKDGRHRVYFELLDEVRKAG
ncbi:5-methylcytosine-specific restriction endonuclease McrA [Bradyrhizobium sp. CIR48]|uniref:HNH endonuclease n=1 Tax=Bradyrhizobium sp. CIR48 TaxID=2663840 RepID=UPI001605909A|nr:HNH endonuclease [Bradyrhizobium sp. CIR48]MBB4423886.1 5-methylcytosine-specific restriction endonuclease McrA [Bradyrhizobium sp. CIR48]